MPNEPNMRMRGKKLRIPFNILVFSSQPAAVIPLHTSRSFKQTINNSLKRTQWIPILSYCPALSSRLIAQPEVISVIGSNMSAILRSQFELLTQALVKKKGKKITTFKVNEHNVLKQLNFLIMVKSNKLVQYLLMVIYFKLFARSEFEICH